MRITTLAMLTLVAAVSTARAAQPNFWPRIREGRSIRVVTGSGDVCEGTLKLWRPDLLVIETKQSSGCGAVGHVLKVSADAVQQISPDPKPPARIVGQKLLHVGGLAGGAAVFPLAPPAGIAVVSGAIALSRLIHERAPNYSVYLKAQ